MMRQIHLLLSTSLLGCAIAAQPASAQDASGQSAAGNPAVAPVADDSAIKEIIVTAERRFNSAQKTAESISVRTGDDLLLQGRYELKNIIEDVPGVTGGASQAVNTSVAGGTDNPATGLVFRGIESNSGVGGGATSTSAAAAIYVDDVYNGIGGSYDINRVEVLRGPQGTLYGRSATAGVVAIHTNDPDTKKIGADATVELGNYDLRHFAGDVNVPIVADKLALRVSGNEYERDGYYAKLGGAVSSTDFRGKLLWTPTDNFSALLGYAQQYNVDHTGGTSITQVGSPTNFVFAPSAVGTGRNDFHQYWGNFNLDLGGVAVTYIPAYRTWFQNVTAVARNVGGPNIDNYVSTPHDTFLTQELRIRNTDNNARFKWQAGFLYYRNALDETNNLFDYDFPPAGDYVSRESEHKVTTAEGLFAEATFAFTPATRLTAGIRYDHTSVTVDQTYIGFTGISATLPAADRTAKFNNVTYKARLEHDLTPQNLLYASIATGFSPGDTSLTQNLQGVPEPQILKAETLTTYEIGSKNRFLNNHLQINFDGYYNNYGGFQDAGINIAPPGPNRIFQTLTVPVKTYGVELEIQARPWANGTFGLNGSYVHARYGTFDATAAPYFSSHTIAPVPPVQLTGSYDHRIPIGNTVLALHGDVRFNSEHAASRISVQQADDGGAPYVHVPGRALADINATLFLAHNVSITGYVRNLTNERYLPDNWNLAQVTPGMNNGPPIVMVSEFALSDPRTFGMVLNFKF